MPRQKTRESFENDLCLFGLLGGWTQYLETLVLFVEPTPEKQCKFNHVITVRVFGVALIE